MAHCRNQTSTHYMPVTTVCDWIGDDTSRPPDLVSYFDDAQGENLPDEVMAELYAAGIRDDCAILLHILSSGHVCRDSTFSSGYDAGEDRGLARAEFVCGELRREFSARAVKALSEHFAAVLNPDPFFGVPA